MSEISLKKYDYIFKLLLIGDSGTGKSSILNRFSDDTFNPAFISTIGIDFKVKTIEIDNYKIKLQIWDTAGQERFRAITSAYYRGSIGIFLVYDITSQKSFDDVKSWLHNIKLHNDEKMLITLIGNKSDLQNKRVITTKMGNNFAKENDLDFYEASAKNNENIDQIFTTTSKKILYEIIKPEKTSRNITNANQSNKIVVKSENKLLKKCC